MKPLTLMLVSSALALSGCSGGQAADAQDSTEAVVDVTPVEAVAWGTASPLPGEDLSETGASMAAIRLSQIGQELLYIESANIGPLLDAVATDEGELELIESVNTVLGPLRASLAVSEAGPTWMRELPLTVKVVDFDEGAGTAEVDVWVWQFMSRTGLVDGELSCGIATYGLAWSGSDGMWLFDTHDQALAPCPGLNVDRHPVRGDAHQIEEALEGHRLVDGTAGAAIGVGH